MCGFCVITQMPACYITALQLVTLQNLNSTFMEWVTHAKSFVRVSLVGAGGQYRRVRDKSHTLNHAYFCRLILKHLMMERDQAQASC